MNGIEHISSKIILNEPNQLKKKKVELKDNLRRLGIQYLRMKRRMQLKHGC